MCASRRRKRRHALNPVGWLSALPPVLEQVTKLVGVVAALLGPSWFVANRSAKQTEQASAKADTARVQTEYANANTNAALGALFVISARLDSVTVRLSRLERGQKATSPAMAFGPEVPAGWVPQPVKKPPRWKFWKWGG